MRPINLQLENFGSYRGQATELDFTSLELFAISGPTGAGKSTLLDAIIFALYGTVPRLGPHPTEMISLGAERMSVLFDFQMGDQRYRVARRVRRRGTGSALTAAQLEQLDADGTAQPLTEGVREVNEALTRIVGLSDESFTQAVVLPQGDFQRFLKSEPRKRRDVLSKILRLEIYRRMQQLASLKQERLREAVEQRERRLSEDYAEATPEALNQRTEQRNRLAAEIETLVGRLGEAEARRDAVRAAREKTRELKQRRLRLKQLQADEPQIRSYEQRLESARRAAPVLPKIRFASAAEENFARAKKEREGLVKQHARFQAEHKEAEGRLKQAAEAATEIPLLEQRIAALDQVIGRLRPRSALVSQLGETKKQKLDTEKKLKEARDAQQKGEEDLAAARLDLRNADETLAAVNFDRALFETLDAMREEATRIGNLRHAATTSATEVQAAMGRLKAKEKVRAHTEAEAEAAEQTWKRASQRKLQVDQELADARHRDAAALLRQELRVGESCPVCEHPVAEHPPPLSTPALIELEKHCEQAKRAESKAREALDRAKAIAAATGADVVAEQQNVENGSQRCATAEANLVRACEFVADRVRGVIALAEGRPIEEQVRENYELASAGRRRHETARMKRDEADEFLRKADQSTERLKSAVTTAAHQLVQHDNRIADLTRQITEIDDEVRKVTQSPDPQTERTQLSDRRDNIGNVLQEQQTATSMTARELAAVAARLEVAGQAYDKADAEARRSRAEARDAAVAAGFADEAAAAQAEIAPAEERRIATDVETHRQETRTAQTRIDELIEQLGGSEVSEETLTTAETTAAGLRSEVDAAQGSQAELDTRIEILIKDIARATELRAELDEQRVQHSLYRSLTLDLRSDRFQAFLLDETFRELVSGASLRLWELTKRYRFDWQNEAFFVVDHDNARQLRSADTLSGGETFLASLALALQLSEQVQKAAGATKLDSLFIDEGFGTLDPEALDAAAGAIENLHVGGRMVGIISHIDELSLRLPARIRVKKGNEGSQISIEAG
jgi:exonuclease SbcC